MVAPLVIVAGQAIMVLGGVVGGVSLFVGANSDDPAFDDGVGLGVKLIGAGALILGTGYVIAGVGGVAIVGGVGLGGYTGVKAITRAVKEQRQLVQGNNLIEEVSEG